MPTVIALFLGFVLTGIGTALLGCVLPALSQQWHLADSRAGALFAAQFLGSALGALLVGSNVRRSLLRGYTLLVVSAACVAVLTGVPAPLRFFCFGLGLGLTMTSTSLWIGEIYRERRGQALSLLNGFWTLGAALCPALATIWVQRWQPTHLFLDVGLVALLPLLMVALLSGSPSRSVTLPESPLATHLYWIIFFATLGFFYVGVESSIGSWLMSYVHRLPDVEKIWAPIVASCFWVALLVGRMLAPLALLRSSERMILTASIGIALISSAAMLAFQQPLALVATVVVAGVALGPIFPLCLSQAMHALQDSRKTKWVFAFPGVGAALFPYLTGVVSTHQNSLRAGLMIPVFGLIAMAALDRLQPATTQAS